MRISFDDRQTTTAKYFLLFFHSGIGIEIDRTRPMGIVYELFFLRFTTANPSSDIFVLRVSVFLISLQCSAIPFDIRAVHLIELQFCILSHVECDNKVFEQEETENPPKSRRRRIEMVAIVVLIVSHRE